MAHRHKAATPTLSEEVHQQIPSILGLEGIQAYCDIWLLLTLVVGSVDERDLHLMRPCQSIFHCRGSPMLSLLHMSHRPLKLNVYAAPLPAHGARCSLFLREVPFPCPWRRDLYCTQVLYAER